MSKALVEEAVLSLGTDAEWVRIECPWCASETPGKKNMAVATESSFFQCHRCAEKGFYRPRIATLDNLKLTPKRLEFEEAAGPTLPWQYRPLHHTAMMQEDEYYWDYVVGRGVHPDTIVEYQIGYCPSGFYAGSIVVPFYRSGVLTGFVARNLEDRQYRYPKGFRREQTFFNHDRLFDDDDVVVVEGVFDALPHVPHTMAVLGKPTRNHIQLIKLASRGIDFSGKRFYFMLDGDARSENWAAVMQLRMSGVSAIFIKTPAGKDPGDLTPDEFYSLIQEAQQ